MARYWRSVRDPVLLNRAQGDSSGLLQTALSPYRLARLTDVLN